MFNTTPNPVNPNADKKLFIKTWGCQMNVYDSHRMADILSPFGYGLVDEPDDVDMMILNTCHIREKATDKVFSELGRLRAFKDKKEAKGEQMIMAVAGCVAQAEGEFIARRAPYVDMVFGPQTYHELPEMVAKATDAYGSNRVINLDFPAESKFDKLPEESRSQGPSAFLSIQEGCDKFCAFCVVPYTRGAEFSRSLAEIVDEAKRLAETETKEITLLGQNVNAYHGQGKDGKTASLADLIAAISDIDGVERIRYTTSHPRDMSEDLIQAHGAFDKLMPFLHLPVQSGSDKVLKAMNRKHDSDFFREINAQLIKAQPKIKLSSDFIVGFPGESDKDFEDTLQLVKDVQFISAYSFKYSARPGTPAANMMNLVPEHVKSERLQALQSLLEEQQDRFNKSLVDTVVPVLFDGFGKRDGQLHAYTPYMQAMHIQANKRLYGEIAPVKITEANAHTVLGELVTDETVITSDKNNDTKAA